MNLKDFVIILLKMLMKETMTLFYDNDCKSKIKFF